MTTTYLGLLRTRGLARLISSQLLARLPSGMISLLLLMHAQGIHHSYAAGGAVLGVVSLGQAVAGPVLSRAMGRWGMRGVLSFSILFCASGLFAFALVPLPLWTSLILGACVGLSYPPVQSAIRTLYPRIAKKDELPRLYALDASAQELIWVLGPVLATFAAARFGTSAGLMAAGAIMMGGGALFVSAPEPGRIRIPASTGRLGAVLARPAVFLVTIHCFLLLAGTAAVEASVVALYGKESLVAGCVLAVLALGSLIGGLLIGHRVLRRGSMGTRIGIVFAGLIFCSLFTGSILWFSVGMFIAGAGFAPTFAAMYGTLSSTVRFSDSAEAFGWMVTGQLVGAALGSAAAGVVIDARGPALGVVAGTSCVGISLVLAVALLPWHERLNAPVDDMSGG